MYRLTGHYLFLKLLAFIEEITYIFKFACFSHFEKSKKIDLVHLNNFGLEQIKELIVNQDYIMWSRNCPRIDIGAFSFVICVDFFALTTHSIAYGPTELIT